MFFSKKLFSSTLLLLSSSLGVDSFVIRPRQGAGNSAVLLRSTAPKSKSKRPRSRVTDPTGPTPDPEEAEPETINPEDIPELHYDENKHPIPHQPWRRGETMGCEDPIDAEWRQRAEELIRNAAKFEGGTVIDVTWFLTYVVITIDDDWEQMPKDFLKASGPVIEVEERTGPIYKDPEDPKPEDIWGDEEEIVYEKDEETENDIKSKMYARAEDGEEELGLDPDEELSAYQTQESRDDDISRFTEEAQLQYEREPKPVAKDALKVDTAAVSTIAGAILDSLETEEEELQVLERHEVILASPGPPDVLETQSQFDANRNKDVAVETQDPWDSNRTLRGKLVDRNSMDVVINQKGRMVTIPLNFVRCVKLLQKKRDQSVDTEELEENYDEDIYED